MLGPVEIHDDVGHDHFTGVVERLAQVTVPVALDGLGVRSHIHVHAEMIRPGVDVG
jgi:hypothetical protein